ncbi:hypothetical protein ACNF42_06270 [Cuniculiplasma sp. SKW3]|uniref:hypothetical protein n=1 Tax=unclassified Cuniculiplasma TaxID=2619706 RepID=UPI003FD2BFB8
MVVIRSNKEIFEKNFQQGWNGRLFDYSRVIGFSYEENGEELKIEFNPDRPDLYSSLTLIDSIKTFFEIPHRRGEILNSERKLNNKEPKQRPKIIAFEVDIRNKKIDVSGDAVEYLDRIGENVGKKRKLFAYGVHDLKKIDGDLIYEETSIYDEFETYDDKISTIQDLINEHPKGKEYGNLVFGFEDKRICTLKDSKGIISIPPLFNSKKTRVDNKTRSLLIDITANTHDGLILGTKLGVGYFTKLGLSVKFLYAGKTTDVFESLRNDQYPVDSVGINKISGLNVSDQKVKEYLKKMGYEIKGKNIVVPLERIDVMGYEDIAEDFIKAYGLNKIEPKELTSNFTGKLDELNVFTSKIRQLIIELGFQEIMNFVLRSRDGDQNLEIINAKSEDFSKLRKNLIGGILEFYQRNMQYGYPQRVFEIGEIFTAGKQERRLAVSVCSRHANYSDIKGYLDNLFQAFGINKMKIQRSDLEEFVNGRNGFIEIDGENIGFVGEISPEIIREYSFNFPVSYFEISLSKLYRKLKLEEQR